MSTNIIYDLQQQKSMLLDFAHNAVSLVVTLTDNLYVNQITFTEEKENLTEENLIEENQKKQQIQQELTIVSPELKKIYEDSIKFSKNREKILNKIHKSIKVAINKCTTFKTILTSIITNVIAIDLSDTITCSIELLAAGETITTVKNDFKRLHETCCIDANNYNTSMQDNQNLIKINLSKITFTK